MLIDYYDEMLNNYNLTKYETKINANTSFNLNTDEIFQMVVDKEKSSPT